MVHQHKRRGGGERACYASNLGLAVGMGLRARPSGTPKRAMRARRGLDEASSTVSAPRPDQWRRWNINNFGRRVESSTYQYLSF